MAPVEGSVLSSSTVVASFTDTGYPGQSLGDLTATIDWGDGTPTNPDVTTALVSAVTPAGTFTVTDPTGHIYADEGTYTVKVTLSDDGGGASKTASASIAVADADVFTGSVANIAPVEGSVLSSSTVVASFTDTGYPGQVAADLTATIDWGDGTPTNPDRSEERRVGKARSSRWTPYH